MSDPADVAVCLAAVDGAAQSGALSSEALRNLKHWLTGPPFESYRGPLMDLIRQQKFAELNDSVLGDHPVRHGRTSRTHGSVGHGHDQRADHCGIGVSASPPISTN